MAPSNWDNHIKESLEKRQLQPSPDAWSKLQNRLESEEKRKSNKMFWWLGLAASIVGIVFISTMFFNKNEQPTNAIVETPKAVIETEKSRKQSDIISEETIEIVEQIKKQPKQNQPIHSTKIEEQQQLVETKNIELEQPKQDIINNFEDEKLKEVVAQIQELKNTNDVVTEDEIDALLKEAEKAIFKEKLKSANTQTVDADALLQDVEADLQQSFRAKVFEALKTSYETVKTAVAERNN
jgi:hypothetical protein